MAVSLAPKESLYQINRQLSWFVDSYDGQLSIVGEPIGTPSITHDETSRLVSAKKLNAFPTYLPEVLVAADAVVVDECPAALTP